jgi:hypothetical protein
MKAVEFESQLNPDRTITVPKDIAEGMPTQKTIRVLVLIPEEEEEREWKRVAAMEFAKGYVESDAIYDQLSAR